MEEGDRLSEGLSHALQVLATGLAGGSKARSSQEIWIAESAQGLPTKLGTIKPDRDLPKALKAGAPTVLATGRMSATLLRAIRASPPGLIVLTGEADPETAEELQTLPDTAVLGPSARLHVGEGDLVLCAASGGELDGLLRAFGGVDAIGLALSPTPPWLWRWLADPLLAGRPVAGYVHADVLGVPWARWAADRDAPFVIVPLGVPRPELTDADEPAAAQAAAAHALELTTGPVFPSPRVVASVLEGLRHTDVPVIATHDPLALATWSQARRALPTIGAVVGMADPALFAEAPTAGFLAQRALLHATAVRELGARATVTEDHADELGLARAEEILTSAATTLTDQESKVVLRGFGIEVTRQAVASSASGAVGFADRIGYPVVLKAISPDLRRRADIGAVELDLSTAAGVRRAYATIVEAVERNAPTARVDGVAVAEMVEPGLDVRCGAVRLPGGDMALYGEVVDSPVPLEPVLALSPLTPARARQFAHAILSRVVVPALRRDSDPNVEDLAALLSRLDAVVVRFAERLATVRLDPVRLCGSPRGAVVLDARVTQRPHLEGR